MTSRRVPALIIAGGAAVGIAVGAASADTGWAREGASPPSPPPLHVQAVFSGESRDWPQQSSASPIELTASQSAVNSADARTFPVANPQPKALHPTGAPPLLAIPTRAGSDPLESIRRASGDPELSLGEDAAALPVDLFQLTTWTAIVLGLGVGAILLLKRLGMGGRMASGPAAEIKLRGTLMLAPRTGVHLVSVASQEFLVAIDPRGVSSVTVVPPRFGDEEEFEDAARQEEAFSNGSRGPRDV